MLRKAKWTSCSIERDIIRLFDGRSGQLLFFTVAISGLLSASEFRSIMGYGRLCELESAIYIFSTSMLISRARTPNAFDLVNLLPERGESLVWLSLLRVVQRLYIRLMQSNATTRIYISQRSRRKS